MPQKALRRGWSRSCSLEMYQRFVWACVKCDKCNIDKNIYPQ